jgi:hypothetical protein
MMHLLALGLVMVAAVTAACGGGNQCRKDCPKPVWVDNPPTLGAVGVGKGINVSVARDLAEDNGRHKLAQTISVKVSGLLENSLQQVLGPEGEMTGHQYAEGIKRTLYQQYLSGTQVIHYWEDCCVGDYFVLITIEKDALIAAANQAAKQAAEKLLQNAEEKHEELRKKFDEELQKEGLR